MPSQSQPIADISASLMVAAVRRSTSVKSASAEASWNHYTLKRLSRDSSKLEVSIRQSWYAKANEKVEVEVSPVHSLGPAVKRLSQFRNPARLLRENGRTVEYMETSNGSDEEKNELESFASPRTSRSISGKEVQGKDVQALWSHAYNLPNSKFCVGKSGVINPESEPDLNGPISQSPRKRTESVPSSAKVKLEQGDDNTSISQPSTYPESTEASFSLAFSREEDEQIPSPSLSAISHDWEIVDNDDSCKERKSARKGAFSGALVRNKSMPNEPKLDQAGKSENWYLTVKKHIKSLKPPGKLSKKLKKARPTSPHAEYSHYLNTHIMQAKMRRCSTAIL